MVSAETAEYKGLPASSLEIQHLLEQRMLLLDSLARDSRICRNVTASFDDPRNTEDADAKSSTTFKSR